MKKLFAVVSILFFFPLSAMALTPMQDSQMNDITAQAGVSIATDVRVDMSMDTIAWGDADGATDTDGAGWVGVSNFKANLFFGLRTDIAQNAGDPGISPADLEVLTIDVGTDTAGDYNGATYVRIGLGTFELSGNMDMEFELGSANTLGSELGTLDIQGMVIRGRNGGYIDITNKGRESGVTLAMNVLLDEINMTSLAWGDSDGLKHVYSDASAATAGYVGLANLDIDDVEITGEVGIDVVTLDAGTIAGNVAGGTWTPATNPELVLYKLAGLMAANPGDMSSSLVILSLGNADGIVDDTDLRVTMATMSTDVAIGSSADLTTGTVMGSLYMAGVDVQVDGLVGISAH